MLRDCEVAARRSRYWLQYLQQARRRELTCEHGIIYWRRRRAAENAMIASVAGDYIGPVWGLFGGPSCLGVTMTDDRERITRDCRACSHRYDAKQNSVQRDHIDRCQTHCASEARTHETQSSCRYVMKPITVQDP